MIYEDTGRDGCLTVASDKRSITGRDRLTWRSENGCICLYHRTDVKPLVVIEPDPKYVGLFRIRHPDGDLSDVVNLSRAGGKAFSGQINRTHQ